MSLLEVKNLKVHFPVKQVITQTHPICSEVRIAIRQRIDGIEIAATDLRTHMFAGAEYIVLRNGTGQYDPRSAAEARPEQDVAGGLFNHGEIHIHLIRSALHCGILYIDLGKVAQFVDTTTRQQNIAARIPRAFHLAHFRAAKIGRNIKKNVAVEIPEHFIPAFKPAKEFMLEIKSSKNVKESSEKEDDTED